MATPHDTTSSAGLASAELLELFPTPILRYQCPDSEALNARLRELILSRRGGSPGMVQTNKGGWHSDRNLHTWPEEPVQTLMGHVHEMVREMVRRTVRQPDARHLEGWKMTAWANVNQKGHFNRSHYHPNSHWSGIYYVDVGDLNTDQPVSGSTVFEDRSLVAKEILRNPDPFEREYRIRPRNGLSVLFPASLHHSVEPYSGEGFRITIAYNLRHPGFTLPTYDSAEPTGWWWRNFRGVMIVPRRVRERLHL